MDCFVASLLAMPDWLRSVPSSPLVSDPNLACRGKPFLWLEFDYSILASARQAAGAMSNSAVNQRVNELGVA